MRNRTTICLLFLLVVVAATSAGQSTGRRRAVAPPQPSAAPPVANADTYSATRGQTLTVGAVTGVLVNDADPQGKPLTALLVTSTTQGNLTLNADGSFVYTSTSPTATSDSFTYKASNGAATSAAATVTINITEAQTTPDFVVTSPGFFYQFAGISGQNPPITLTRGRTYRFQIDTDDIHPFEITGAPAGSVTNNNISFGIITFTVPASTANYQYRCSLHNFGNKITTTP